MKSEKGQLKLRFFIPILLLLNFIIIFIIFISKGQFEATIFFKYVTYASFVNIILGALTLLGNVQSRSTNLRINRRIYSNKGVYDIFSEEMTDRHKALVFTAGLVATGVMMLLFSIIFNNLTI